MINVELDLDLIVCTLYCSVIRLIDSSLVGECLDLVKRLTVLKSCTFTYNCTAIPIHFIYVY